MQSDLGRCTVCAKPCVLRSCEMVPVGGIEPPFVRLQLSVIPLYETGVVLLRPSFHDTASFAVSLLARGSFEGCGVIVHIVVYCSMVVPLAPIVLLPPAAVCLLFFHNEPAVFYSSTSTLTPID